MEKLKFILALVFVFGLIFAYGYQQTQQPEIPKQPVPPKIDHMNQTNQTNETQCRPEILFSDDFENYAEGSLAADNWYLIELDTAQSYYGVKSLDGNKAMWLRLRGTGTVTDALLIKRDFDDFELEFEIHDDKPYDTVPAIVVRFDENGNYYLVTYNEYAAPSGTVRVYKMPQKELLVNNKISVTTLQDGRWHKFKIIANGTRIEGWIDDLVKAFEINGNIEKGKIGFANSDGSLGSYYVDNVAVRSVC